MAEKSRQVYRNFATVVYADSAPEDWISRLEDHHIQICISPYHDQDVLPTGEPKKPHWHVLIAFESQKTLAQAQEVISSCNGVGCEIVKSLRGYTRYLCHLDSPDKVRYSESDILTLGGFDYPHIIECSSDRYAVIGEMIDYCVLNNIYSYSDLVTFARENKYDWFRVLCDSGTIFMVNFLKSLTWSDNQSMKNYVDDVGL